MPSRTPLRAAPVDVLQELDDLGLVLIIENRDLAKKLERILFIPRPKKRDYSGTGTLENSPTKGLGDGAGF